MDFIDNIINWFKGLGTEETVAVIDNNEKPKDTDELELRLMRQLYKTNKKQEDLLFFKKQLEREDFKNKHSCRYCKFCKVQFGRYATGKEYICLVKEECVAVRNIYSSSSDMRESMKNYYGDNDCAYFRKIEYYRGYSIEEIMSAQEREEDELCI